MPSTEDQVPDVATQKIAVPQTSYGISDPWSVSFFTSHLEAGTGHAAAERALSFEAASDASRQDEVVSAVKSSLDALWGFLDGAYATC